MFGGIDFGVIEVGCLRVGFFGMVSKPWDSRNEQYEGDFFPDSDIHTAYDYEATAAAIVAAHGDEVDVMVMLSHLGLGTDRRLAENVSGIDVILGGHSHTTMPEPETVRRERHRAVGLQLRLHHPPRPRGRSHGGQPARTRPTRWT